MAPVESDAASRTNLFAYAPFGSHVALVLGLTAHVLLVARRAAKSLPPTTATRSQQPLRRRYAAFFSVLAALSLASVATFAVVWRAISYVQWAESGAVNSPSGVRTGWHQEGRWYLGDWITDIDLRKEADKVAISTPEGFLYTTQHFVALLTSAIFFGVEGHRRNLPATTIASFVVLGATGSLGYALSLFFVTILYTPLTIHDQDTPLHDALFTPSPRVYYAPIAASLLFLHWLPEELPRNVDASTLHYLRYGRIVVPLLLAFAPQIVPVNLGRQHVSKVAAHRSYARVFRFLSVASFVLYWRLFITNVSANTPHEHHHVWDIFTNSVHKSKTNRLLSGMSTTGQRLRHISKHPVISVTSIDVLFTVISLLAWTFTRNLDVDAILENSILAFLVPKHEKHVAFKEEAKRLAEFQPEPELDLEPVVDTMTPRKRGRPAKNKAIATNGASISQAGSVRRSSRRTARSADVDSDVDSTANSRKQHMDSYDSDADSAYQPDLQTKQEVAETEADGVSTAADLVHGGESTALAMFLAFAGGLGQLAASALGAEVTGPRE